MITRSCRSGQDDNRFYERGQDNEDVLQEGTGGLADSAWGQYNQYFRAGESSLCGRSCR